MVAKCGQCHAVFPVEIPGANAPRTARPPLTRPASIVYEETEVGETGAFDGFAYRSNARPVDKRFKLTWRWWTRSTWFLAFFAVFWNGFLVVWYTAAFSTGGPLAMKLFPLIHVAVGAGLGYFVLVKFFNRSQLVVDENGVGVSHGPLPWPRKAPRVHRSAIDQLYCEEYTSHRQNNRPISAYKVMVRTVDRARIELVRALDDPDKALYIEQLIEQALAIEDRPVPGELPR